MAPRAPFKRSSNYGNAGAGAREGLKQKMDYWASKDFETEYSIAVSQAMNLAYAKYGNRAPTDDEVFAIFQQILKCKLDSKFQDYFKKYFEDKLNKKASDYEKAERALEEAMRDAPPGVDDFGDGTPPLDGEPGGLLVK